MTDFKKGDRVVFEDRGGEVSRVRTLVDVDLDDGYRQEFGPEDLLPEPPRLDEAGIRRRAFQDVAEWALVRRTERLEWRNDFAKRNNFESALVANIEAETFKMMLDRLQVAK